MSTFKRLFNVGKGKAKVARQGVAESFSGGADGLRHSAADAAESLAETIRPDTRGVDLVEEELREPAPRSAAAEPRAAEPSVGDIEEAEEVPEKREPGPRKRSL
jgi:hypothetical protein